MASHKSKSLLLNRIKYSETSNITKFYTREFGIVSLIAKGAQRPKSKFKGHLEFFHTYECIYYQRPGQELGTLTDISIVHEFKSILEDIHKQALANVMIEIYLRHLYGPEPSIPLFEMLHNQLDNLDTCKERYIPYSLMLCEFFMQFCSIMGFGPQFESCGVCGNSLRGYKQEMDFSMGSPICGNCEKSPSHTYQAYDTRIFQWLNRIQLEGVQSGSLAKRHLKNAENLLLQFLQIHSSHSAIVKSYDFYSTMCHG